jgi:hypothetical protein
MTIPKSDEIKKITKVFQSLLEEIESQSLDGCPGNPGGLPDDLEDLLFDLQQAHGAFQDGLARYLHNKTHEESERKVIKIIVENDPGILLTKDNSGRLPIHCAAYDDDTADTFVRLLAKAGIGSGVLDEQSERGGLLIKSSKRTIPLHILSARGNINCFKALLKAKLFCASDVAKYFLVHNAAYSKQFECMKWLICLCPSALFHACPIGNLPLHWVGKCHQTIKYLLMAAFKHDAHHVTCGGLFAKNKKGHMPIYHIIKIFGRTDGFRCILDALSSFKNIPLLHKCILHAPDCIDELAPLFPHLHQCRDEHNRLPIYYATESTSCSIMTRNLLQGKVEHHHNTPEETDEHSFDFNFHHITD